MAAAVEVVVAVVGHVTIRVKTNRTSVRCARKRLQTLAICHNTREYTKASSRTAVRFVSENSLSCRTYSSTFVRTRATNRTNAGTPAARKRSHNYRIYSRTRGATNRTNRTSVTRATSVSRTKRPSSITFQSTRTPST